MATCKYRIDKHDHQIEVLHMISEGWFSKDVAKTIY